MKTTSAQRMKKMRQDKTADPHFPRRKNSRRGKEYKNIAKIKRRYKKALEEHREKEKL